MKNRENILEVKREANLAFFLLYFNTNQTLSFRTSNWEDEKTPLASNSWLEILHGKSTS